MTTPQLVVPKIVSLKNHQGINEKWLEDRLTENPSLLGLGELVVQSRQRRQPTGGKLDLLLYDAEGSRRYTVEVQLGATDESHIIRTIEYWDIERRRYPQYEHVAVIVAEDITTRFLNVISLFNGAIPLIAIQLRGVELNGAFTLVATQVLGLATWGTEEEDEGEVVDRSTWQQKAYQGSLQIMDTLHQMTAAIQPGLSLRYTKYYVGLQLGGAACNFVIFRPKKAYVLTEFKIQEDEELTAWLDETGLSIVPYDTKFGKYRLRIRQEDIEKYDDAIQQLIKRARDAYPGLPSPLIVDV